MADIIAVAVFAVIILSALVYIINPKKGTKCIGCPMAGKCNSKSCR